MTIIDNAVTETVTGKRKSSARKPPESAEQPTS